MSSAVGKSADSRIGTLRSSIMPDGPNQRRVLGEGLWTLGELSVWMDLVLRCITVVLSYEGGGVVD